MFTFEDAVLHAQDYLGTKPDEITIRESKRAALTAYRNLANSHPWTYLFANGRINLNPAFGSGTVTFDSTTDIWTVADGDPLPAWTGSGSVRVGEVIYKVWKKLSATTFQTYAQLSPPDDIIDASSYVLYQDTYVLPSDFTASDQLLYQRNFGPMSYVAPGEWLRDHRFTNQVGECRWYTVTGDDKYPGRLVARLYPYPGEAVSIDFVYRRRPRPLSILSVSDGLMSCTSGTTSLTVSGSAIASSSLVGSVVRLSSSTAKPPTSVLGSNPPAYEGIITDYASGTYTVDQEVSFSQASLKYVISDPVDIDEESMLTAFQCGIWKEMSMQRVQKDRPSAANQYTTALRDARASDSRSFAGRAAGQCGTYRQRLARMPFDWTPS